MRAMKMLAKLGFVEGDKKSTWGLMISLFPLLSFLLRTVAWGWSLHLGT